MSKEQRNRLTGLTQIQVEELVIRMHLGGYSQKVIAAKVGMSQSGISRIIARKREAKS